jgi:hypothetical protein
LAPWCDTWTIHASLTGVRVVGQRRRGVPNPFEPFAGYCRERLVEDPHLWATTPFDELLDLGYDRSYPTFTRQWVPETLPAPVDLPRRQRPFAGISVRPPPRSAVGDRPEGRAR